jgi:hypothetical protein
MNEMQLFRLMQKLVGEMNQIVTQLYNGTITFADAKAQGDTLIQNYLTQVSGE